jgi:hypothetical protein
MARLHAWLDYYLWSDFRDYKHAFWPIIYFGLRVFLFIVFLKFIDLYIDAELSVWSGGAWKGMLSYISLPFAMCGTLLYVARLVVKRLFVGKRGKELEIEEILLLYSEWKRSLDSSVDAE